MPSPPPRLRRPVSKIGSINEATVWLRLETHGYKLQDGAEQSVAPQTPSIERFPLASHVMPKDVPKNNTN